MKQSKEILLLFGGVFLAKDQNPLCGRHDGTGNEFEALLLHAVRTLLNQRGHLGGIRRVVQYDGFIHFPLPFHQ